MTERLRLLFCDHLNIARGKYLPASKIGSGSTRACQGTFALTYDREMTPAPGGTMLEGLPDMDLVYDAADIRQGWQTATKVVIADAHKRDGGGPLGICPRSLLKRTVKEWEALGYRPKVGIELEAYAFVRNADGKWVPMDTPGAYVYGTGPFVDPIGFTDAIWETATKAGFNIEGHCSEYDTPQFEYTLVYDDALKAVDDIFLFRLLAREVAYKHGVLLTFMPKPILNKGGSGVHINFSFLDKQGNNVIASQANGEMSPVTRGCIAGLLEHHKALAALLAPIANSYQRLKPASLSGFWKNWGVDHRGVTVRLSAEGGKKARIEHRMGDGAASIYTLTAAVLQAAKLGVTNNYALPPAETHDCLIEQDAKVGVAESLEEALKDLAADKVFSAAMGDLLVQHHLGIKEGELGRIQGLEGDALRDYYIYHI